MEISPKLPPPYLDGSNLWLAAKVSVVILGVLTFFLRDMATVFLEAFYSYTKIYIFAIPVVFAYLVLRRQKILRVVLSRGFESQPRRLRHLSSVAGALLVLTAVLLYWNGSYTSISLEYHMVALPLFSAGLILFLFNSQTFRLIAVPIVFLFFLVPPPSEVFAFLWILILIGILAFLIRSEKKFKSALDVKKKEQCSKCHPIMQGGLSYCLKCGRTISTVTRGAKNGVTKLIVVVMAFILLFLIQVPFFALTNNSNMVVFDSPTGQQKTTSPLPDISGYTLQFSYRDNEFEEISKVDLALAYVYTPQNDSLKTIWVSVEVSSEVYRLHRWEIDLINNQLNQGRLPRVSQYELKDVSLLQTPALTGRFFAFQYTTTDQKQAVLYWYESARFAANATSEQKDVGISLIAYPENWEELPEVQAELETLAKKIVDYWQPIKLSSVISIAITQNGAQLAAITTVLVGIVFIFYILELKKQKKIGQDVYQKLSLGNKQIIDAIKSNRARTASTLSTIIEAYRQTTSKDISVDYLLIKLEKLEKLGIVKSEVDNNYGEPIIVWTSWA